MIERREKGPTPKPFTLRQATEEDLPFLYRVSTEAMRPVSKLSGSSFKPEEERFKDYKTRFVPEAIQVIQHNGEDVGRLRVVRSPESIYVGGIQLLPEHQGKGIGTALFAELIEESNQTSIPILLEVHEVNARAIAFYKSLGFEEGEKVGNQTVMRYLPSK
ncbi:MAG TPA: GNAT family N-acetyltransferase [Candidatus Paceibacterota bacterium]|nr:GNAT family N-acetyltransferase [Candidatus Paceibacterota bacterium]